MKKLKLFLAIVMCLFAMPLAVLADEGDAEVTSGEAEVKEEDTRVKIYFFRGEGCPHCEEAETFFQSIQESYGDLYTIVDYETWYNTTNSNALAKVAEHFKDSKYGVPYIIVGKTRYNGFGDTNKEQILAAINDYYNLDERANLIEELGLEVVADAPEKVEKTKTAVVIVVVLAICVGAAGLIYMVSKSEE